MSSIADMLPDNPGILLFHCHIAGHKRAGMIGRYQVNRIGLSNSDISQQEP